MSFATLVARNLLRRKVRTALTIAGLAIGIAAVVALLGIAWGFERSFLKIYESKQIDLVVVRAGASDRLTSNLDQKLGDQIRKIPGVRVVAGSLMDVVSFEEANLVSVLVNGWEPGSLLFRGIRDLKGRALRPGDTKAAMLGRVLALNLEKDVGDTVNLAGEPFQVVGIFESESLFENGGLIVPLAELQRMMGRAGYVSGFVLEVDEPEPAKIQAVAHQIESQIAGVAAVPARDFVRSDIQIRLVKSMAWATSIIAMVLGSVGILNTMLMTVFERTGEIGVLRALGWRRARVLNLILGEALTVGLVGSLVGLGLGILGVKALALEPTSSSFIAPDLPPAVLGFGLVLGIGLSLIGGLYPALRAAALDPTEALRHD